MYIYIFCFWDSNLGETHFLVANDFARELLLGSEIILTVGIIFKGGTISFRGKLFEGRENYFCFFFLKWGTMI